MLTALLRDTAIVIAAAGLVFVLVLIGRRLSLGRRERERAEAESRLRPLALGLLEGDAVERELARLPRSEAAVLGGVLARFAPKVSGAASERIAEFFERRGFVDAELRRLRARRAWRRAAAAFALGDMGAPRAVPPLLAALHDRDRDVRSAAARSLGRLGSAEAVAPLVRVLAAGDAPRAVAGQALLALGPEAVPGLLSLVRAEDAAVRATAIELVGLLGDAADAPLIAGRLRDPAAEVRAKACRALGRLGAEEAGGDLRAALSDRVPFVRVNASVALGMLGDQAAVPELVRVVRGDRFFEPAQAASAALVRLVPDGLAVVAAEPGASAHLAEAADLAAARA